jgi:acetolactate synthase-1/2/3 large subunit
MHQVFRVKSGQRFYTSGGLASMGWGLPGAIGACVASGKKRTVCVTGDGGLMMNLQELSTIMHYRLPVKVFIFNNGGYLTMKFTFWKNFERVMGCDGKTGLSFPLFDKIAESFRMRYLLVDNHDDVRERVTEALALDEPVICEMIMDRVDDLVRW